ncbi:MAG: hypothetical protein IT423_19215 [Pirellulaceae bacterium]|nr:hypothetical protein [Pirellulaceae bacterium]
MRAIAITSGLALALVAGSWLSGFGQQTSGAQGGPPEAGIQVLSTLLPGGNQQIVVFDSRQQSMAVYQIQATGKIQLTSVRKIQMDLAIEQFNAVEPLPSEMRLMRQ